VVEPQRRLTTPRAAAVAGVLFAVLFGAVLLLVLLHDVADPDRPHLAAVLTSFAGIAFLWFIGVVRDGFGRLEDRFFSTVFIGSGLLFLAMIFVATAVGAAVAHGDAATLAFGRELQQTLSKTYALRMAAVFMMSLATIWLRTGLMPRPLTYATYAAAVGLILAGDVSMWLTLVFPAWVLVVSLLLLVRPDGRR
jgi:hypothetical protein